MPRRGSPVATGELGAELVRLARMGYHEAAMAYLVALALTFGGFGSYLLATFQLGYYREIPLEFFAISAAGVLLAAARAWRSRSTAGALVAMVCLATLLGGARWILIDTMYLAREDQPRIGDVFPAFRLRSSSGEDFLFRTPRERPSLILFYRGDW